MKLKKIEQFKYFRALTLVLFLLVAGAQDRAFSQRVGNGGNFTRQELKRFLDNLVEVLQLGAFAHEQQKFAAAVNSNLDIFDLNGDTFRNIGSALILLRKQPRANSASPESQYCLVTSTSRVEKIISGESIIDGLRHLVFFDALPLEQKKNLAAEFDKAKTFSPTIVLEGRAFDVSLISSSCLYDF